MEPDPAEIARTIASGLLPGVAHVHRYPDRLWVRHTVGVDGVPLLLTRAGGELAAALLPEPGATDTAMVLCVDDVVPSAGAPWRGRVWLAGWARRLDVVSARSAVIEYARTSPTGDLLDVGRGHALYRMEVADVRLARDDRLVEVDVDEFRTARPDPLHREERQVLADLAAHHGGQITDLVSRFTGARSPGGWRPVRLDRYGLVLAGPDGPHGTQRVRVPFARPAEDVADMGRLLSTATR
jgi:heme iron utilization protein